MVDGAALLTTQLHELLAAGLWTDQRGANLLDGAAPFYTVYETADGRHLAVGALEPQFWAELLERVGLAPDDLPPQLDRDGWPVLRERLAATFRTRTRDEWCALLEGTDACVAPVLSLVEAPTHPHNRSRATFVEVAGVTQPAPAPASAAPPAPTPTPPAAPDEDAPNPDRLGPPTGAGRPPPHHQGHPATALTEAKAEILAFSGLGATLRK